MKALITGGAGFLGKALMEKIPGAVSYDLPEHTILKKDKWNPNAVYDLEEYIKDCDCVIHAAAVADLNESAKHKEMNQAVNIDGTENVAKLCRKHKKIMVFISTCCVYGNPPGGKHEDVITEETHPYPTEIYAKSKLMGEMICAKTRGLRYRVSRIATLYGPGMRPELFSYIALDKCEAGEPIDVHGDGEQTRTYIYIDDVVAGIILIAAAGKNGEIYNVAGTEETSVLETIRVASKVTGKFAKLNKCEDRPGQIFKEKISSAKLEKFGWRTETCYTGGMVNTFNWMKEVQNGTD